jgi:serine/threonine protein kinase
MADQDPIEGRGRRSDYACEQKPLGRGGYAEVFPALHKPSGVRVAFKRLRTSIDETVPERMRREIKVMGLLDDEPHVMPVLDFSARYDWYVMPLAEGDAVALRAGLVAGTALVEVLAACVAALRAAHDVNYAHRDITPHNVLRLEDGTWVLSDWGLARAHRGHTTRLLTGSGGQVGTEGFVAPEVMRGESPGNDPAADVYSLGRVAAWALEGRFPLAGEPMIPSGPFRRLVKETTREDPRARPSLAALEAMLTELDLGPAPLPVEEAERLVEAGREGDRAAWEGLLALALDNLDDEVVLDQLRHAPQRALGGLAEEDPGSVGRVAEAMRRHLDESFGERSFSSLDAMLSFIFRCCRAAAATEDMGLLEDCAGTLFAAEASCHQYGQRHETRSWLEGLRGEAARTVARALRADPAAVDWYTDEGWRPGPGTDRAIRSSLSAASSTRS